MDLLRPTPYELQHWGSSSKGTTVISGGNKLPSRRERAGGAAFSQTEGLAEAIVPLMSPPPIERADGYHI